VLGWQNGRESFEDISVTVDAIDVSMDVGVVYRGLDEGSKHQLISVVCYYGQHYHCFAYNQELARWVMFDDSTVKVVGDWEDVARTCRKGHLQPQVLFYEAVVAC
jgi:ubiquitin C-terminal hydrolase